MAIRRVTRYVDRFQEAIFVGLSQVGCENCKPVTIEYDDGKEEPQVKTRERRIEGFSKEYDDGHIAFFNPAVHPGSAKVEGARPAILIVTEPVPQPSLVEAAEQYLEGMLTKSDLREAVAREKQKSTR